MRQAGQQRFLVVQLAVSAVLNALISALFVWLVFRGTDRITLWGGTGLAADLVPTTFMITLMSTIALTLATRGAVRAGKLEIRGSRWRIPRNPFLRGLLFAAAATLLLVPLTALVLWAIWSGDWSYDKVMLFKIAYGVALGFVVTPIIISAAAADPAR